MLTEKVPSKYHCENCDYTTSRNSQYSRHLQTAKHKKLTLVNEKVPISSELEIKCENCKKCYSSRVGLWKHKKKCDITDSLVIMNLIKDNQDFKTLLIEQQRIQIEQDKENKELQHKLLELAKNQSITNTNCHNTTNNQQFNLQFFLNETCKDAINMVEFVKSIQLQLGDLEETARLGYVDGVSRIFVRALNDMEVNKRPIHCTDIKRETVYVKNNDNWEKEGPEKKNLKKAVDYIANKNMYQIDEWKEENPNWTDYESQEGQVLNKIYMATTCGGREEEDEKYVKKIIKNVLREVVVEKD
ncbi:MAG: hypothetical protein EBU93_01620 [Chlamydiae bacterium]|nr:hypothetical protein [Chlamydiota bacterium]